MEDLGPLTLHSWELKMLGEVKYLGLILDSKLNWNQYFQKITRKAVNTFAVARLMYGKRWGLRPNKVHWLYTRVIILYYYYYLLQLGFHPVAVDLTLVHTKQMEI